MPAPRADFSCSSKKCRTEEGSPVYEDLPITSTRCPVCGSKRITRLWNSAPHVSHGVAKHVDALVARSGYPEQRHEQRDARLQYEADLREAADRGNGAAARAGVKAGPAANLGAVLQSAIAPIAPQAAQQFAMVSAGQNKSARADGVVLGGKLPRGRINHEAGEIVTRRPVRPHPESPRWNPPK